MIAHVDMDAFFASVEQLTHPEWRGKPVIVGADPQNGSGRGVVAAASYEARKFGIHSAMPVQQAWKRCPQGIYVHGSRGLYESYSQQIFGILEQFSPQIEPLSIDEAFLDLHGLMHHYETPHLLGEKIKNKILKETGLIASVGIAPVKSVAKIASDLEKPDGLVVVTSDAILDFLAPLPISRLWGVGKRTEEMLARMHVKTFADLWEFPLKNLEQKFGKLGTHLYYISRGEDKRIVQPEHEIKSISNEHTFYEDVDDVNFMELQLLKLATKVGLRLRHKKLFAQTVHLKVRFSDFKTITRSYTASTVFKDSNGIFSAAITLFNEIDLRGKKIRLLGVGVSQLLNRQSGVQLSLFDAPDSKAEKIDTAMEHIHKKFGKSALIRAGLLQKGNTNND